MNDQSLALLLSPLFDRRGERLSCFLHLPHLEDLARSGLSVETIDAQKIRSVPPWAIDELLGFRTSRKITSALLFPFLNPAGGYMNFVRMRIYPALETKRGTVRYLQPRRGSGGASSRLYFVRAVLDAVLYGDEPLVVAEGEKKAAALGQLGMPAVGISGVENWHVTNSTRLLPDFDYITTLHGRVVDVIPDADVATNPAVARAVTRFISALQARGARPRVVVLPREVSAA